MIDWVALVTVLGVSVPGALLCVSLVASAVRLLATPPIGSRGDGVARDAEYDEATDVAHRPWPATIGAYLCIAAFAAVVLFGVWLLIPHLH